MIEIPDRNSNAAPDELPEPEQFEGRVAEYAIGTSNNPDTPYIPAPTTQPEPALNWWETAISMPGMDYSTERAETLARAEKQFLLDTMKPGGLVVERGSSGTHSPWKKAHDKQFDVDYVSHLNKMNRTYTGIDVTPVISIPGRSPVTIGEISTISISTHMEKFPVRTCGRRNPLGFSNGQRTIAGSLVFSLIDVYPFYRMMNDAGDAFWDLAAEYPLADSLPPFDITITLNNEYEDRGAVMRLFGVTIVDDGTVFSIDDLVTENTYSYMAIGIAPVHRTNKWEVKR